jgi:hypothetical protein
MAYIVGGIPASPYKFTSFIKHHGIILEPHYRDGKTMRGIKVDWKVNDETKNEVKP